MTTAYEEFPSLACGQCIYFGKGKCKRVDHDKVKFILPYKRCYDEGQFSSNYLCNDFEPNTAAIPAIKPLWHGIHDYLADKASSGAVMPKPIIWFCVNGEVKYDYGVPYESYFYNRNLYDQDGNLNWTKKRHMTSKGVVVE